VASPQELYDRPVNLFVGGFIGSPAMNMVEARLERRNGSLVAAAGSQRLTLDDEVLAHRPALAGYDGRTVVLGIRPEDIEDVALAPDTPPDRRLHGKAVLTEALGSEVMAHFTVDARQALTEDVRELAQDAGSEHTLDETAEATIVARFGPRSRVGEGDAVEAAVDTRALHFFDPGTGNGIYDATEGAQS
jgi:multiple sugar transport system ATP-binding protein